MRYGGPGSAEASRKYVPDLLQRARARGGTPRQDPFDVRISGSKPLSAICEERSALWCDGVNR